MEGLLNSNTVLKSPIGPLESLEVRLVFNASPLGVLSSFLPFNEFPTVLMMEQTSLIMTLLRLSSSPAGWC